MRICGFLTCVCLQVYSSASPLRLGPQRVGLAFASDAASGCKPEFSQLETPEWTSRDSNHHRQSVSAGKTRLSGLTRRHLRRPTA